MGAGRCTYDEPNELCSLGGGIGGMACKEEVISGLDAPSETHEDGRVGTESGAHGARDHLFILGQVGKRGKGKAPVGDGTPEMRRLYG